jgi:HEAT repeat protein
MHLKKLTYPMKAVSSCLLLLAITPCWLLGADQAIPDQPEKALQRHRIAITKRSVFAALRSNDLEIRKTAADVAAKRWPKPAIPALEQAMRRETDELTLIRIATDLAKLGNKVGRQALVKECHNNSESASNRMSAATTLSRDLGDDSCIDSIIDVLRSDSDPNDTYAKQWALELARDLIRRVGAQRSETVFELVMGALNDPSTGVRIVASMTLDAIGDPNAIPSLESAIAREEDEGCRQVMARELQGLKKKNDSNAIS